MPANLPPNYLRAEDRYREATTPDAKIEALEEMLAIIPKHKGTDHLRADLRHRLSGHRKEAVEGKKKGGRGATLDHIEREGAGQVALVGEPNAGKSSIVAATTAADAQVADYPFTTYRPTVGMMAYEDAQIQLVDLPPISAAHTEAWVFNIVRNVDLVLLVVDLSRPDSEEQVFDVAAILEDHHLILAGNRETTSPNLSLAVKHALILATKCETPGADAGLASLMDACGSEFTVLPVSVKSGRYLDELPLHLFDALNVLRVYTKAPGKPVDDSHPYVLPRGSTVLDVAEAVHKDLVLTFRFARIWGSEKYDGQQVKRDHVVQDGDVIEVHVR